MTFNASKPKTIGGIKRRAKEIQREQGFTKAKCLDLASRIAGYQNYKHAYAALAHSARALKHRVTIIEHWFDPHEKASGTEGLTFELKAPLNDFVKSHQLRGRLGGFKISSDNTLEAVGHSLTAQDTARWLVCRTARTLQFMAATGLKPSSGRRGYPRSKWENRPPQADHDVCWYDPITKRFILTDEPYPDRARRAASDRTKWAQKFGMTVLRSDWAGMHNEPTELYLIGKAGHSPWLEKLTSKLSNSPAPINQIEWDNLDTYSSNRTVGTAL